ncbi:hypothetical protein [Fictibacillus terranigra]|uniref:Uncharacterized protein n=1 Tax=Fictibacillus terranigra TaxID=3058424 RepID=A0ABT8E1H9_9BACL|nr:hypothetical protein [Fictibacillus sp. CENA-BCM004]MDN4071769.1 hypothetical protein [Fictibacillus sp. CENA-BCM004]
MAIIRIEEVKLNDIAYDFKIFPSKATMVKKYRLMTNGVTGPLIKLEKMSDCYYVVGNFEYFFSCLYMEANGVFLCNVSTYENNDKIDRYIRTLNNLFVEGCRYWSLKNFYIKCILADSNWDISSLSHRLKVDQADLEKFILHPSLGRNEKFANSLGEQPLFNYIKNSPLSAENKHFLFSLASKNTVRLTQKDVSTFIDYHMKQGNTFNCFHPDAENIFWEIVNYMDHVKNVHWRDIEQRYFTNPFVVNKDLPGNLKVSTHVK